MLVCQSCGQLLASYEVNWGHTTCTSCEARAYRAAYQPVLWQTPAEYMAANRVDYAQQQADYDLAREAIESGYIAAKLAAILRFHEDIEAYFADGDVPEDEEPEDQDD